MRIPVLAIGLLLLSTVAKANIVTAVIDKTQVHLPSNGGYVLLKGGVTFDGGGCTNAWAAGNLDDEKFMVYVWPMLMSAKNYGKSVTISVSGCTGTYPKIEWVQVNDT